MLHFYSAVGRGARTEKVIDEVLQSALGERDGADIGLVLVNAPMGHKLDHAADAIRRHLPGAQVLGASCAGVVGREGAGEAMTHLALMAIEGPSEELATAAVDGLHAHNAYEKGLELAHGLQRQLPTANIIYLVSAGLDTNCDLLLEAFDAVFGPGTVVFGGTASDNYKALATFQYLGDRLTEHGAFAVGFADPTLHVATRASHGFVAYGEPMTVTEAEGNRVLSIDGKPAWMAYAERLSVIPEGDNTLTVLATGALANPLPPDVADSYGSPHILRSALRGEEPGVMYLVVTPHVGDAFYLTTRDEDRIFAEQERALRDLQAGIGDRQPVAVFQSDCLARGRTLFDRVAKDELVGMMQEAIARGGHIPPWLGLYGFGEFCPLCGRNTFHTYTTSLMVLCR